MSINNIPPCSTPPGKIITHYKVCPLRKSKIGWWRKDSKKSKTFTREQFKTERWWDKFDCEVASLQPKGRKIRGERVFGQVTFMPVEFFITFQRNGEKSGYTFVPKAQLKD